MFCHDTSWRSALWHRIADVLSDDFTVYLWDTPRHGTSTMAQGQDVSLAAQASLLCDLLQHWSSASLTWSCMTTGGAVALRAHLLHGARYRSLALVDVVALAPWGSEFFRLVAVNAPVFAQIPLPLHEALLRADITALAHRPLAGEHLDMLAAPWLGAEGQAAFDRQIAQASERYTRRDRTPVPGNRAASADRVGHRGHAASWLTVLTAWTTSRRRAASHSRRAGHLVQLDAPEHLTAVLQRWLMVMAAR